MARQEADKENLLRDATALVARIELAPVGTSAGEHVVAGFRRNGALSIFFGAEPVYHFNPAGELRRAYCDGMLYKSLGGRLVSLRRKRDELEVQLLRHELSDEEQRGFVAQVRDTLDKLQAGIEGNRFTVVGEVPQGSDVLGRLREWLRQNTEPRIATEPNVG
jgi:hypothetical protein